MMIMMTTMMMMKMMMKMKMMMMMMMMINMEMMKLKMMMMMMVVSLDSWIRYPIFLPLPLTAFIGADRDANANEFTCERSLEFEVV